MILQCYVSDRTIAILKREAIRRGLEPDDRKSLEQLAENAIEEAALMSLPPHLRVQEGAR
jgi:hypothetical protein